jgi:hypothetical protein
MSSFYQVSSATSQPPLGGAENRRKPYRKPQLEELGDLRTLTLGGSPGLNDSGSSTTRRPPGNLPQFDGFPPLPPPPEDAFSMPGTPPLP